MSEATIVEVELQAIARIVASHRAQEPIRAPR